MKNLFREYITLTDEQILALWNNATFVFDTNTLLNFYRYSAPTANALREAINSYADRVWLPNQVGKEYFKNRLTTISGQENNYNEPKQSLYSIKDLLSNRRGHPFISSELLNRYNSLLTEIENEFKQQTSKLNSLIVKDEFYEFIIELFNEKVGNPFSEKELSLIYEEGRSRYADKVPPGFGDKKPEPDKYGDLIVWKQILSYSKDKEVNIIFISDEERKGDWMHVHAGKTLGPLPLLKKEFHEVTGKLFHMYPAFRFLELAFANKEKEINPTIIEEVKEVSKSSLLSDFKIVEVRCEFVMKKFDYNVFKDMFENLENTGYSIDIITEESSETQIINVKLPFKDLERRFRKKIDELTANYNILLSNYTIIQFD
jgi:hypothetical protein